jgi:hypothetical protein
MVGTVSSMSIANRFIVEDLPDSPYSRQLRAGFPWLTFDAELEAEFRQTNLDQNLHHIRLNLGLAITIALAFSAVGAMALVPELKRIPSMILMLVIIPMLLIALAVSFSARRHRYYPPLALAAGIALGLSVVAIQLIASLGGVSLMFPCLLLTAIFI